MVRKIIGMSEDVAKKVCGVEISREELRALEEHRGKKVDIVIGYDGWEDYESYYATWKERTSLDFEYKEVGNKIALTFVAGHPIITKYSMFDRDVCERKHIEAIDYDGERVLTLL